MTLLAAGRVWKLSDDVDTDMLAPTRYLSLEPSEYSKHCLENVREDLAKRARKGDVIVAGENFGKGSSREHAAMALRELGIRAIVARSIAPIIKRNLFNLGIPAFEDNDIPEVCEDGDKVEITMGMFKNITKKYTSEIQDLPDFMLRIFQKGGLFELMLEKGGISTMSRPLEDITEIREVGTTKIYPAYEKYVDVVIDRLEKGEVLCGPFDTTYGLFASIKRPDAVKKVYELKKRSDDMPLTMIVPRERFEEYAEVPDKVKKILFTELKGPVSIILPKRPERVPDYVTSGLQTVSLADGENPFMKRVMEGIEICGTSANISGMPPPSTLNSALRQIGEGLSLAVDGGPSLYRIGHTVIDLASDPPKLIRAGPYHTKKLIQLFPELIGEEEGLPDELVKGHSIIDLSPEVEIRAINKGE